VYLLSQSIVVDLVGREFVPLPNKWSDLHAEAMQSVHTVVDVVPDLLIPCFSVALFLSLSSYSA
jgi:hypothetical protein